MYIRFFNQIILEILRFVDQLFDKFDEYIMFKKIIFLAMFNFRNL